MDDDKDADALAQLAPDDAWLSCKFTLSIFERDSNETLDYDVRRTFIFESIDVSDYH
jgi:hypothetical protein